MTAYRNTLLLLSGMLAAASAAAQPRLSAPDPAAYTQPGLSARLDTHGDRHPHVEHGRNGSLIFRNERLVAELARGADGTYGPLYLYPATRPTQPWSAPLAQVDEFAVIEAGEGDRAATSVFRPRSADISRGGDSVVLRGAVGEGSGGWTAEATLSIDRDPWLSWNVTARPGASATLTRFSPMSLRIGGAGPRTTLLPGVQFSEASSTVGGYSSRPPFSVDPLSVTVPVIAAAQGDVTVGLMWDPRQAWGGAGLPAPSASFPDRAESPAAATGVQISVPAAARGAEARPLALAAGRAVTLSGKFLVLRDTEDVASVARRWEDAYGRTRSELPGLEQLGLGRDDRPSLMRSFDAERELARQAYGVRRGAAAASGTAAERDLAREAAVQDVLAQLLDAGLRRAQPGAPARATAQAALSALQDRGSVDPRIAYRAGGVLQSLDAMRGEVQALIRSQVARGSWPLGLPSTQPSLTEDLRVLPEKPEDVEVGTITPNALTLLRYAAITGDSDATGAGMRALEYIDRYAAARPYGRFRVPAGAGEPFPQRQVPTLYSAAQAAECFLLGYQVTGEPRYLDSARYWADTGLPFVYLWEDPAHPALRGASVSRFTTDGGGRAEQRVGLYYARVLEKLQQVRPDSFYDRVIRSIVGSALRQQAATGANAGLLPEFWDVREGRAAGAWLMPGPLVAAYAGLEGYDFDVSHVRVRTGPDRLFVASGATIDRPTTSAMRLRLNLKGITNQEAYTTVTGVAARPIRVEYNSVYLPVIQVPVERRYLPEAAEAFQPGWFYDDETGLLTIRARHTGGTDHLEVRWPDPRERTPINRVDIRVRNNR